MSRKIELSVSLKERNNEVAEENRQAFKKYVLKVLNLIGSPGCGKTTILESTAKILRGKLAVIEGDLATEIDTDRLKNNGCQAVQIQTGGGCHLNAEMVQKAFKKINIFQVEFLIIENVGNLVCPATFDLGEDLKVAVLSLPEGDDKPAKYPGLFIRSKILLINKIDLEPLVDFDIRRIKADCRKLNPDLHILKISAKTGKGMEDWLKYLRLKP